jgi:hypothetical protein
VKGRAILGKFWFAERIELVSALRPHQMLDARYWSLDTGKEYYFIQNRVSSIILLSMEGFITPESLGKKGNS